MNSTLKKSEPNLYFYMGKPVESPEYVELFIRPKQVKARRTLAKTLLDELRDALPENIYYGPWTYKQNFDQHYMYDKLDLQCFPKSNGTEQDAVYITVTKENIEEVATKLMLLYG